jgi:ribosome assembly protein 4
LRRGAQDTTINVWETTEGKLVRQLKGHGHWVNTLGLSTEHALRTGPFDHTCKPPPEDPKEAQALAQKRCVEKERGRATRSGRGQPALRGH